MHMESYNRWPCVWLPSLNMMLPMFIHVYRYRDLISFLWPTNRPVSGYTMFYWFILQLMGIWAFSPFSVIMNMWPYVLSHTCFCVDSHFQFSWVHTLRMAFLGHMVILCFIFWGAVKLFYKVATPFYIPTSSTQGLQFLQILVNTWDCPSLWL